MRIAYCVLAITHKECLHYILYEAAGSSSRVFTNGVRDRGRNGERLSDFVSHRHSKWSGLSEAHVLALRLYTSAAYKSLNGPLRQSRDSAAPHPFPVMVSLIAEGLKRLRSVAADRRRGCAHSQDSLAWHGDLRVDDAFASEGGTEMAPLSATSEFRVAIRYALSSHSLLFKMVTKSFMDRGVDLSYLSCFPEESEHLFAPLTYLRPTGNSQLTDMGASTILIVEVEPSFGT